jgi:hypothetical protein
MRSSTTFVTVVLSSVLFVSFATGAELKFHLDFSTDQVSTAAGKQVLVDRAGGLQAELHNIAWTRTPSGKVALFNGKIAKEGGSCVVVPGTAGSPFLVDFERGPFTIEVWFRLGSGKDYRQQQELVNTAGDTGPGYRLTYAWRMLQFISGTGGRTPDGKQDYWAVATNPATHKVVEGGWNHVAVVRDGPGLVTLFLNGAVVARSEKPFPVTRGQAPITIGAYLQGYAYPFLGAIGEVRIYRGARTAAEVYASSQGVDRHTGRNLDGTPYALRLSTPVLAETRMADGRLHAELAATLQNTASQPADLRLNAAMVSSTGEIAAHESQVRLQAGEAKALRLPFSLTQPGQYRAMVCLHRGADLALFAEHVLPIRFVPVAIDITQPFYRNNIYATEDIREIKAAVRIGISAAEIAGTALRLTLKDAVGSVITSIDQTAPAAVQPCRMRLPPLAVGVYQFTAQLKRDGKVIAETATPVRKLGKAPGREVRIDEKLRVVIDGKPILPIVWWSGAPLAEIAKTGSDGIIVGFTRNSRPVLDQLQAVKQMGCVMLMDSSAEQQLMDGKTEFTPAMRQYVSDAVQSVIDHPAMLCWYLVDEPEVRALSPNLLQRYYELLAELDPFHPVLITNDSVRGLHTYASCQDMFVPDPYILPVKGGGLEREMTYVVSFMQGAREAGKGRKLIGLTPQVFNYGDAGQHNGRAPTFTEQRAMQYLGIVHGCRMFNYYIYRGIKGYPDLELGVPPLMREIRALTPVILEGSPLPEVASSDPAVHAAAWRLNGQLFVIACNTSPKTLAVQLTIPGAAGTIQVVSESRQLPAAGGRLSDSFAPYATHIYTTDLSFQSPIRLAEIEKRVKAAGGMFSTDYGH